MPAPNKATIRLGSFLRDLRDAADLSTVQVGEHLDQDPSTVGRYERGELRLVWAVIKSLVEFYGGTSEQMDKARTFYNEAKNAPKPVRLPKDTSPAFRRYVNEERVGKGIRTVQPLVVPGLLQIEEYTQGLGDQLHVPSPYSAGVNSVRRDRQQRLDPSDPRPLQFHAVVDEIVLTRRVGGPEVMRKQLLRILDVMGHDNVTFQVVKAEAGAYGGTSGGLVIVDYDGDETSGVYFEYPAGSAWVENEADVQRFTNRFHRAARAASSPDETAEFIHQQVRILTSK